MERNVVPKPLGNYGKNVRQVKHGNDTKVGSTCTQSLLSGSSGGKTEDGIENEAVGD